MDDREEKRDELFDESFDELLADSLTEAPDGPELFEVNPWQRPIRYVIWGIFLTTVTFNFFSLQYILPTVGMALLVLGFRALRRENGSFRAAWVISILRAVMQVATLVLLATPAAAAMVSLGYVLLSGGLQILQLIVFRYGIIKTFKEADASPDGDPLRWLLISTELIFFGGLLSIGDLSFIGWILIMIYIAIIVSLRKISRAIGDTGYALQNAPVRVGDGWVFSLYLALTLVAVIAASCIGAHRAPAATAFVPADNSNLYPELVEMGFPENIFDELPAEDAALFADAVKVTCVTDTMELRRYTPYERAKKPTIDFTTVYVEVPGKTIYILQAFEWVSGASYWGDALDIWADDVHTHNKRLIDGGLLYDKDGETFISGIPGLRLGSVTPTNVFFGTQFREDITGRVAYPFGAERQRGYVLFSVQAGEDLALTLSSLDYYHAPLPRYPYVRPEELLNYGKNYYVQNYSTYYIYGEFYDLTD